MLIVTRDYGDTFRMRDAYIYLGGGKDGEWNQISYVLSGSPVIKGELTDSNAVLKDSDGRPLLLIPIQSVINPD
jgi:hypothetical protein